MGQARLGEIYSRTAAFYDGVVLEHQRRAKLTAIELLARRPRERFLEAGVGTGWAFERIVAASGTEDAAGLDVSEGMLEVAAQRLAAAGLGKAELLLGSLTDLPFRAGTFDCLLCTYTLDVMPSMLLPDAARELYRVLRPGGRLDTVNLTPGEGDDAAFTVDWLQRFERDPEYFGGARPLVIAPLLVASGFAVVERHYSGRDAGWPAEIALATRPL